MTVKELIEKYPKIFVMYEGNPYGVNWDLPDGWIFLVDQMCNYLQWHIDRENKILQVRCIQMKEKFGGLRFYVEEATEIQHNIINYTEGLSYHYCQDCGCNKNMGRTNTRWIITLCEECSTQEKYLEYNWKSYKEVNIF